VRPDFAADQKWDFQIVIGRERGARAPRIQHDITNHQYSTFVRAVAEGIVRLSADKTHLEFVPGKGYGDIQALDARITEEYRKDHSRGGSGALVQRKESNAESRQAAASPAVRFSRLLMGCAQLQPGAELPSLDEFDFLSGQEKDILRDFLRKWIDYPKAFEAAALKSMGAKILGADNRMADVFTPVKDALYRAIPILDRFDSHISVFRRDGKLDPYIGMVVRRVQQKNAARSAEILVKHVEILNTITDEKKVLGLHENRKDGDILVFTYPDDMDKLSKRLTEWDRSPASLAYYDRLELFGYKKHGLSKEALRDVFSKDVEVHEVRHHHDAEVGAFPLSGEESQGLPTDVYGPYLFGGVSSGLLLLMDFADHKERDLLYFEAVKELPPHLAQLAFSPNPASVLGRYLKNTRSILAQIRAKGMGSLKLDAYDVVHAHIIGTLFNFFFEKGLIPEPESHQFDLHIFSMSLEEFDSVGERIAQMVVDGTFTDKDMADFAEAMFRDRFNKSLYVGDHSGGRAGSAPSRLANFFVVRGIWSAVGNLLIRIVLFPAVFRHERGHVLAERGTAGFVESLGYALAGEAPVSSRAPPHVLLAGMRANFRGALIYGAFFGGFLIFSLLGLMSQDAQALPILLWAVTGVFSYLSLANFLVGSAELIAHTRFGRPSDDINRARELESAVPAAAGIESALGNVRGSFYYPAAGNDFSALLRLIDLPQVREVFYLDVVRSEPLLALIAQLQDQARARGVTLTVESQGSEALIVRIDGRVVRVNLIQGDARLSAEGVQRVARGKVGYAYLQAPGDAAELQKNPAFNAGIIGGIEIGGVLEVRIARQPFNYLGDALEVIGLRDLGERDGSHYYQKIAEVPEAMIRRWMLLDRTLNQIQRMSVPRGYRGSARELGNEESDVSLEQTQQLVRTLPPALSKTLGPRIISLIQFGVLHGFVPERKSSSTASILGNRF
jgi:hypothetical protein